MSDCPGGVVHVSSSSFCWIAALIGCQMSWHHCTHEEGVAAPQEWGTVGTVCCCTVAVVDFEGRYRFGCLSTAKSVKEGIIERDFTHLQVRSLSILMSLSWCNCHLGITTDLGASQIYKILWLRSFVISTFPHQPNMNHTFGFSTANIFQFLGCFSIEYVEYVVVKWTKWQKTLVI